MDYSRKDRADALAAEYVSGTMRGGARRRFESLLPAHPALREATLAWSERLMPLTAALAPVEPSGEVWRRISDRLDRRQRVGAGAWERLPFWRGLTAFASVAAIGLAVLLANPRAVAPPVVVVLAATGAAPPPRRSSPASAATARALLPGRSRRSRCAPIARSSCGRCRRRARRARSACCRAAAVSSPCAARCSPVPTRSRSRSNPRADRRAAHRRDRSSTQGNSRCRRECPCFAGQDCSFPNPSLREGGAGDVVAPLALAVSVSADSTRSGVTLVRHK